MSHPTSSAQEIIDESIIIHADHIPVIARMCHRIGLIDIINENIPCNTDVDIGTLVVGMVCDTLSGRSPLYKVEDFIKTQDTELLFGIAVDPHRFNDDALGNGLDRIHNRGTLQLFTEVALKAASIFSLDTSRCHFDTTSVNVWGDYPNSTPGKKAPHITYGYSKDKRMDLKQFMVSMLCVEGNIPISGKMQNGNSSDDKLNNEELQRIGKLLRPLKDHIGDLIYVADCKLINSSNLASLKDLLFISRFPANFKEHNVAIKNAIQADDWEELGILAETPSPSLKRQRAIYRSRETSVQVGEQTYRALVIQTDHLDKKRTKGIENKKEKQKLLIEKKIKSIEKATYHCLDDAQKKLDTICKKKKVTYWNINGSIDIIQVHAPGKAPKTGSRKIIDTKYKLVIEIEENTEHYQEKLKMAGCFVMITNTSKEKMTAREVLKTYKGQCGVEQNFSFLKEPLIANDIFLKKPSRIDALTFILLVSLLIWNLIQRELRNSAEVNNGELKDLNKRPTKRPTSYLMMSHLSGTIILRNENQLLFPNNGISPQGLKYLNAMGLDVKIYTTPPPRSRTQRIIQI